MLRIVVVSDSHRNTQVLERIASLEKKSDLFLHCGDACDLPQNIKPFIAVKGNCDFLFDYPESLTLNVPPVGEIYLFHGIGGRSAIRRIINTQKPKILLFGHTHCQMAEVIDGCYVFNPGSVTFPRDGSRGSYLVIEANGPDDIKWEFKEI